MRQYLLAPVRAVPRPLPDLETDTSVRADWDQARPVTPAPLTHTQRLVYDYIRAYQKLWGASPLYREIADACELRGSSSVHYQICRLAEAGWIRKPARLRRAILLNAVPVPATRADRPHRADGGEGGEGED